MTYNKPALAAASSAGVHAATEERPPRSHLEVPHFLGENEVEGQAVAGDHRKEGLGRLVGLRHVHRCRPLVQLRQRRSEHLGQRGPGHRPLFGVVERQSREIVAAAHSAVRWLRRVAV